MAEYFDTQADAEQSIRRATGEVAFYGRILQGGREKWMIDFRQRDYSRAAFSVIENLSHTIEQVLRERPTPQAQGSVRAPEASAAPESAATLDSGDFEVRVQAMAACRAIKDRAAVPRLIALLGDTDSRVREEAAYTLESLGDPKAVDALILALGDLDGNVRLKAARALGVLNDRKAVEPLMAHLRDPDPIVHVFVAHALRRLGDGKAVSALQAALESESHEEARQAISEAMAGLGVTPPSPRLAVSARSGVQHPVPQPTSAVLGVNVPPARAPAQTSERGLWILAGILFALVALMWVLLIVHGGM